MRVLTQRLSLSVLVPVLILLGSAIHGVVQRTRPPASGAATRITVIDVGQGDAILMDGPGDAEILIDGGPTPDLVPKLARLLGDDRTLDLLVLTHPHADHLVGLVPVLTRYTVGRILMTGVVHTTGEYERFLETVRDQKIPTTIVVAGQTYDVGPAHLEILSPFENVSGQRVDNLNSSSIVAMVTIAAPSPPRPERRGSQLQATSRTPRVLLTGDAESDVETALLDRYCPSGNPKSSARGGSALGGETRNPKSAPCPALAADVLKVPHHGSQDSSSLAFLTAVQPEHAIVSVGRRNDYGHPHRRALKRLERTGARIWRTDLDGDVTVAIGSGSLSVTSER